MKHLVNTTLEGSRKGTLVKGEIVTASDYFSKKEIEDFEERGHLQPLDEKADDKDTKTLDELIESDPQSLTVKELKEICSHYKIATDGKKADLIKNIEDFEEILALEDLTSANEEQMTALASYTGVELTGDVDTDVDAIEAVLK